MSDIILNDSSHLLLAQTLHDLIDRDANLSPAALARALGIPTNKITRILNGDVTDPKASTLLQIASYFDITIEQLLGLQPIIRLGEYETEQTKTRPLPVFEFGQDTSKIPKEWYRWSENEVSGNYYALAINSERYEPIFPRNSLLIINPDIEPEDHSYVVVKETDVSSYYSVKKYVVEGHQVFLYPIDPKLPVEVFNKNSHTIAGVILEVHQKLRSKK